MLQRKFSCTSGGPEIIFALGIERVGSISGRSVLVKAELLFVVVSEETISSPPFFLSVVLPLLPSPSAVLWIGRYALALTVLESEFDPDSDSDCLKSFWNAVIRSAKATSSFGIVIGMLLPLLPFWRAATRSARKCSAASVCCRHDPVDGSYHTMISGRSGRSERSEEQWNTATIWKCY